MKGLKILALATLIAPAMAFAGAQLDFRSDYKMVGKTKLNRSTGAIAATEADAYNAWEVNRMNLNLDGKLNDKTSMKARVNALKANAVDSASGATQDKTAAVLEYAWITHKPIENLALNFGKQQLYVDGVEGLIGGGEMYMRSVAGTEAYKNIFMTGFGVEYTVMEGNVIGLQMLDNKQANDTAPKKGGNGFYYKGSLMDKMIEPLFSMYNLPVGAANAEKDNAFMSLGANINVNPDLVVEFDYINNTHTDQTTVGKKDSETSIVLGGKYKMENWVAQLRIDSAECKVSDEKAFTSMGTTLAVEYFPTVGEKFNYHFAYTSLNVKPAADGSEAATDSIMYVGVRMVADMLK